MNAVIYARYSSFGQREQSIEAQLAACHTYAKENDMVVIGEYIDRASTARDDNRADFQRMVADSADGHFNVILCYQFDRFARNRFQSAIYKSRLKEAGVKVVSIKEAISDDPAGALLEGLLESLGEYYSSDLALKVKRGQALAAERCLFLGGFVPLGYKIDEERRFVLDEEYAPIVRRMFSDFADGKSVVEIVEDLKLSGVKTRKGTDFVPHSLQNLLKNTKYKGVYSYGNTVVEDGMPRIVSDEVFEAVQERFKTYKHTRPSKGNYLLTGKLFCGMCKNAMVGISGTSHTGSTYNYYTCQGVRQKTCSKKSVRQDHIEQLVLDECRSSLADESNIAMIAKEISALCEKETNSPYLKQMKKELKTVQTAIENLMNALERGEEADLILERIKKKRTEQKSIEAEIAREELRRIVLTEDDIKRFYHALREGSLYDKKKQRMLINALVNRIYLYDDKAIIFCNAGSKSVEVTVQLQENVTNGGVRTEQCPPRHVSNHLLINSFAFSLSNFEPKALARITGMAK